jgi:hypothetical protein
MKAYLDTEFDGFGGDLLSIGIIDESEMIFYYVLDNYGSSDWVKENVIPKLKDPVTNRNLVQKMLYSYLKGQNITDIYCDWYEDAIHFLSLYRGHIYGESFDWPINIHLVNCEIKSVHHALDDAKLLMRALSDHDSTPQ